MSESGFLAWLKRVFHPHQWVIHEESVLVDEAGKSVGRSYYLRCTVCGEMKRRSLYQ